MHNQCVIAEYRSRDEARVALEVLEKRHFSADSVSVVARQDKESLGELGHLQEGAQPGQVPDKGAGLGTLLGGAIATPIALSTAVAPFFIAGPLAGMAVGAAVGGAMGGAKHWGVSEEAAQTYQQRVEAGSVLVIVNDEETRLDETEAALQTTDPVTLERFAYTEHGGS